MIIAVVLAIEAILLQINPPPPKNQSINKYGIQTYGLCVSTAVL